MLRKIFSKSYVYVLIALFYIPLIVGFIYSFSAGAKRGNMSTIFNHTNEGWNTLKTDTDKIIAMLNSIFLALIVALIVVVISLVTVFGLWRQKNRTARIYVAGTSNIPLVNPDIITAISLSAAFGAMFGVMSREDTGYIRLVIAQATMILPFGITLMNPRSEKFKITLLEASKDLGYGPIRTWFKTYFFHMIPVTAAVFGVALMMSLDDFIITRVVSKETTIGKLMYEGSLQPWVLALGAILMIITLSSTLILSAVLLRKERRLAGKTKFTLASLVKKVNIQKQTKKAVK